MNEINIAQVALSIPVNTLFDYSVTKLAAPPLVGARVLVSVGSQKQIGIVVKLQPQSSHAKLKPILQVIDQEPIIDLNLIELCSWASNYYHKPIGEVLLGCLPKVIRSGKQPTCNPVVVYQLRTNQDFNVTGSKQQQLIQLLQQQVRLTKQQLLQHDFTTNTIDSLIKKNILQESELNDNIKTTADFLSLNSSQQAAVTTINSNLNSYQAYLLYGITGSGKTEVYLHCIRKQLQIQQQVLILVPEIGLTPQLYARIVERFGDHVGLIHSCVANNAKACAWLAAQQGKIEILIGTRSALFTPMPRLGLIIVDEEHDSSYKQSNRLRYHARDTAVRRASLLNIPIILGSATPSLTSLHNANTLQKYHLLTLPIRTNNRKLPTCSLLDVTNTKEQIAKPMLDAISQTLKNNHQVLLFLNRRGYAPVISCVNCKYCLICHNCDKYLTWHKQLQLMLCHSCLAKHHIPSQCPSCKLAELKYVGIGTEKLTEQLQQLFPKVLILRIDQDSTSKQNAFANMLTTINSNQPMILIGTQMLAKGHHFANVAMVGIFGVDDGLYSSDFNATEKMLQTITQVAGRAGRADIPGMVYLQTNNPNNQLLQDLVTNDYLTIANKLLLQRQQHKLPPFCYHGLLLMTDYHAQQVIKILQQIQTTLIAQLPSGVEVFGPIPAMIEKQQNRFNYHLVFTANNRKNLHLIITQAIVIVKTMKLKRSVKWAIDIDPIGLP